MANNLTDHAENRILEHMTGKTAWAKPSIWIALYTTVPAETGSGTEVTGGGYARIATTASDWTTATNGQIANAVNFEWSIASANWGTVAGIALVDAATGGNVIMRGPAVSSKLIESGDTFRILAGSLILAMD